MKKPTEKTPYVFVYGTLMSGLSNNRLLRRSELIDTATTEDELVLVASSLPFLLEKKGKSYVSGEIYRVTEDALYNIDQLEGHPDWYERKMIEVVTELGDKMKAWAYFMPESKISGATVIESGSYREYVSVELENHQYTV